jgi:hypothetical protein
MEGFGDNSNDDCDNSWSKVLGRRGRGGTSAAAEGRGRASPATAPPRQAAPPRDRGCASTSESSAGGKPATRKGPTAIGKAARAKVHATVFTRALVHQPRERLEEVATPGGETTTDDVFVVGTEALVEKVAREAAGSSLAIHFEVFEGIIGALIPNEAGRVEALNRQHKGKPFIALAAQQHAPPGAEVREARGYVTVRLATSTHPNGGTLIPREWCKPDWWRHAMDVCGASAIHVRVDGGLDLVPRPTDSVVGLAGRARAAGLSVDRVAVPRNRKWYLTIQHPDGATLTAVARAAAATIRGMLGANFEVVGALSAHSPSRAFMVLAQRAPSASPQTKEQGVLKFRLYQAKTGDSPATAGAAGQARDPRGPRPAVLNRRKASHQVATQPPHPVPVPDTDAAAATATSGGAAAASPAGAAAMCVDEDGWEGEDVAGIEGSPNFTVYADRRNPAPPSGAGGSGGFAAAMTAAAAANSASVERFLGEGTASEVVQRIAALGKVELLAPLFKRALVKDARVARLALGLDGGPGADADAEGVCFELCRLIDDREVTTQACAGRDPPPERWTELLKEQGAI